MRIRSRLAMLVLVTLIPMLAFSAVMLVLFNLTTEGQAVYAGISRSPRTGWTIALGVPVATADVPLRSSLWLLLIVATGSTLLGVLAAVHGARQIGRSIASLSATAAAFARGEQVTPGHSALVEVNEVGRAMAQASEERQRREAAAARLAAVARELAGTLDLAKVAARIASAGYELLQVRRAALYRAHRDWDDLVCVATAGDADPAEWMGRRLAKGEGVPGRVLAERRLLSSSDVRLDPAIALPPWIRERMEQEQYGAVTGVPLRVREQVLGVLALGYDVGRVLADEELRLLSAFADQAAVALENARLFEESELRRRAAEGLAEVGRTISQSLDPQEVNQRIVDSVRTLLSASTAIVYRLDPEREDLAALAVSGESGAPLVRDVVLPAGIGAAGLAVRERRGVVTEDILADPQILVTPDYRSRVEKAGYRATLAVPLMVRGQPIGALGVGHGAGRVFHAEDVRIAQAFADQAAIAIENARLHRETQERLAQSETLLAVGQEVSATLDVTEMMRRVAKNAARALGADMAGAFLASADHTCLRPIAGYRVPQHLVGKFMNFAIPLKGSRVLEEAWERHRAVACSDVAADPGVDRELLERFPHRSNLFCPMVVQGEPIGALFVTWLEEEHRFTPAELRLVEGISRQAAIALANARLVEDLKAQEARLQALLGVGHELSRIQPVESLLGRIAETCGRLFEANSATFVLVEGEDLVPCGNWSLTPEELVTPDCLKIGESLTGIVAATGEPLVVQDPVSDPRLAPAHRDSYRRLGVRAFLGVPVRIDERVIGVLTIRTCRDEGFSVEFVEMARAFASQAAIAFENSRLYQELQGAFQELSHTQDQLVQSQKMQAIGQLAGGVAHDFNNLLTVITGQAYFLLHDLSTEGLLRERVELIQKTGKRAADLTRQLLAFSRKQVLQPKPLDLNGLVEGVAPMLRRLIGEHIELVIVPGSTLGRAMADPGQLEQVVMNLVVNARDAMPDGGIVRIETENRDLHEVGRHAQGHVPPGRYVVLSVRDAGCGMDATTLSRIFEPFFTTKDPGLGTGLGLSTVHGIVHQSGGFIGVDSTLRQGTTFTIYLPRTGASAATAEVDPSVADLARGQETVLLVEDEEDVRNLAVETLTACGYTVFQAGNPREAIAIGEQHRGDIRLLISDMVMPVMRGPALAKRLLRLDPGMRVLYVSGYTDEIIGSPDTIEPAGAFLQKPFTPNTLARMVRRLLDAASPSDPHVALT